MKKILVPTDFSENAKNAYEYAKALAKYLNATITVHHYWYPDASSVGGFMVPPMHNFLEERKTRLAAFVGDDKVASEVVMGFPGDLIEQASATDEVDLIVMGTTGDSNVIDKMFGSISTKVSQNAHCPVWLVSPNGEFSGIKNIMFASDFETSNNLVLHQIVKLGRLFKANVHLVHINEDQNSPAVEVSTHFEKIEDAINFNLSTIDNESVWEGLNDFVKENDIDLTVVVTKHRSFWENLWHKSQTKNIVLHAQTPLVVLHVDDEKTLA